MSGRRQAACFVGFFSGRFSSFFLLRFRQFFDEGGCRCSAVYASNHPPFGFRHDLLGKYEDVAPLQTKAEWCERGKRQFSKIISRVDPRDAWRFDKEIAGRYGQLIRLERRAR